MDSRKIVLRETGIIAIGQLIAVPLMLAVFAVLHRFDSTVLLGGILGGIVAILNFFFMAVTTCLAADRAEAQEVKSGKAMISLSYPLRLGLTFLVLFLAAKSGLCNPISLVVPLLFLRPTLTLAEFFRKSGEAAS